MAKHHAQIAAGPSEAEVIDVPKAEGEGAHTVAEVWAKRADLKGAKVKVRAKVVKATRNVMGRTFLHVRDGTGTAGKDNDLTVTTTDEVAVGEVVTLTGTVSVDRDFGAGYAYPVIVEGATLAR
jgi:aspartyl/asparaginyl-tRNA synthetase